MQAGTPLTFSAACLAAAAAGTLVLLLQLVSACAVPGVEPQGEGVAADVAAQQLQ